jgi:predicted glycosyltransferase
VFDTADEYRIHDVMGDRVHYCGYVCNMNEVQDSHVVREQRAIHEERVVTVMAGGGADSVRLMRASLEAIQLLSSRHSLATLMVTGPFFPPSEWNTLARRAEGLGVRLERTVGDSLECISAADVVVGMAGYNTLSEIQRFGKRAVIVPRPGPSAEQTMRSRLFAERGLIDVVEQDQLTPQTLAEALERALDGDAMGPARIPVELDGVANATDTLIAALPAAEASPTGPPLVTTLAACAQNGAAEQRAGRSTPGSPSISTSG